MKFHSIFVQITIILSGYSYQFYPVCRWHEILLEGITVWKREPGSLAPVFWLLGKIFHLLDILFLKSGASDLTEPRTGQSLEPLEAE